MSNSDSASVRTEIRDDTAWILMNRPDVSNALDFDALRQLATQFEELRDLSSVRAIVLTGDTQGERPAFAAGGDIGEFATLTTEQAVLDYQDLYRRLGAAVESVPQTTIAAIAGPCVGGGAILAATCDLRIAAPSARFGVPVARTLGNCLNRDDYVRLVSVLGHARVKELVLTARLISAAEMKEWGVVSQVVESESELHPAAARLATTVVRSAPLTVAATKEQLLRIRAKSTPDESDHDLLFRCFLSEDFANAVQAFQDGNRPVWRGR